MSSPNPTQPEEEYGNSKVPDVSEFAGIEEDENEPQYGLMTDEELIAIAEEKPL